MSRSTTNRKSLRDFFHVVFKRKLQILLFFLITVCVITVVTFMTEPIYEATSKIETFYPISDSGGMDSIPLTGGNPEKQIHSIIEILTSLDLAKQVAGDLGPTVIYKNLTRLNDGVKGGTRQMPQDQQTLLDKAAGQLQNDLTVEEGNKPSVIKIKFRHPDRYMATTVVNKLVTLYFDSYLSERERRNITGGMVAEKTAKGTRIQSARLPVKPIKPKVMVNLILAIFAGFLGAFVLAFVREYLDDSLEKSDDIEDTLELPILAYIPEKERITDEIMGTLDKEKVHVSKVKPGFPNVPFSPDPKWILAACLVIIAGVIILFKGLGTKREETMEPPAQVVQNVFSAKIDKSKEKSEETRGGQEEPEVPKANPENTGSISGIPLPQKVEETGLPENQRSEKQEGGLQAAGLHQEAYEKIIETSLKEDSIETKSAEPNAGVQAKEADQMPALIKETETKIEDAIPEKKTEDGSEGTTQSPKEKMVEEKPGIPKGTEKKYAVALTRKPNDFFIQVGAFGKISSAEMTTKNLRENGFDPYLLESDTKKNRKIYRVRVKFDTQKITADQAVSRLKELGYRDCFQVK